MTKTKRAKMRNFGEDNAAGYVCIAPWLAGFFIFTIFPLFSSLYYSFTTYNLLTAPKWVGLSNFQAIFADPRFYQSMKITFTYALIHVPLKLGFALGIAILFNMKHRGIGLYRTAYYLPSIIGGSVAVSVMWMQMFNATGAFNSLLGKIGITVTRNWVNTPDTSLMMIILLAVWQFGSPMLIFLAGLKQIPISYYEAAGIDGANPLQKFVKITLPCLSPVIFFNLLMQLINAFMAFTQVYIISNGLGGPSDTTLFYALYMFLNAFKYQRMGYGSALAWIMVLIIAFFTFIIFKTSGKWVFYEDSD